MPKKTLVQNSIENLLSGGIAVACGGGAILSFYNVCNTNWSIACIAIVDVYLLFALFVAAIKSSKAYKCYSPYLLPDKIPAVFFVACYTAAIIFGFANIYYQQVKNNKGAARTDYAQRYFSDTTLEKTDAVYFSMVTGATVGYGDIYPKSKEAKKMVMAEIASCMLLFFCAFPLLIGRITNFKEQPENDAADLPGLLGLRIDTIYKVDLEKVENFIIGRIFQLIADPTNNDNKIIEKLNEEKLLIESLKEKINVAYIEEIRKKLK